MAIKPAGKAIIIAVVVGVIGIGAWQTGLLNKLKPKVGTEQQTTETLIPDLSPVAPVTAPAQQVIVTTPQPQKGMIPISPSDTIGEDDVGLAAIMKAAEAKKDTTK